MTKAAVNLSRTARGRKPREEFEAEDSNANRSSESCGCEHTRTGQHRVSRPQPAALASASVSDRQID